MADLWTLLANDMCLQCRRWWFLKNLYSYVLYYLIRLLKLVYSSPSRLLHQLNSTDVIPAKVLFIYTYPSTSNLHNWNMMV